jgi:UDP-N-acetylmuramate dehydrogenase
MEQPGFKGRIVKNASMKRYTSMKVGGRVPYLFYPSDEEDVACGMAWLKGEGVHIRFLGKGSNVIIADGGLKEGVIRMTSLKHLRFQETSHGATVDAGGGLSLKVLIRECCRRGLSGLEKLYGIPGTVGGAIKMNAGSFGVTVSDCLKSVRYIESDGSVHVREEGQMTFGYRTSPFGKDHSILKATFLLLNGESPQIRADMDYVWQERWRKHPMTLPSAGSIFKNREGAAVWRLIDQAGLRGMQMGGARVSEKHPNFIVNTGGACARDVKGLIDAVKKGVYGATGVTLEEEVELWGFDE